MGCISSSERDTSDTRKIIANDVERDSANDITYSNAESQFDNQGVDDQQKDANGSEQMSWTTHWSDIHVVYTYKNTTPIKPGETSILTSSEDIEAMATKSTSSPSLSVDSKDLIENTDEGGYSSSECTTSLSQCHNTLLKTESEYNKIHTDSLMRATFHGTTPDNTVYKSDATSSNAQEQERDNTHTMAQMAKRTWISCLQKGIDKVIQATEEDKCKNYAEALRLYGQGVEYFLHAIKYEAKSEEARNSIRQKCELYLNRADKLREFLNKNIKRNVSAPLDSLDPFVKINEFHGSMNVVGLDQAKNALKAAIGIPFRFPRLYKNKNQCCSSIMLFGPVGTGKTMLVQNVAQQAKNDGCTFCSVSLSLLLEIRFTDMKRIFDTARKHAPAVLFLDEFESLCNGGTKSDIIKSVIRGIINQMRDSSHDHSGLVTVAATNRPEVLDETVKRIFETYIYVEMPKASSRTEMFKLFLKDRSHAISELEFEQYGRRTDGYSRKDIYDVIQDALDRPIQKVLTATHFKRVSSPSRCFSSKTRSNLLTPCSPDVSGALEMNWTQIDGTDLLEPTVTSEDIEESLSKFKPSVNASILRKFEEFSKDIYYKK